MLVSITFITVSEEVLGAQIDSITVTVDSIIVRDVAIMASCAACMFVRFHGVGI